MKNLKRGMLIGLVLMLMLIPLLGACAKEEAPAPPVEPIVLTFAGFHPETSNFAEGEKWWGSEVEKRTGGKVKFEYYFGGSLLGPMDLATGIGQGVADGGFPALGYTPANFPLTLTEDAIYVTRYPDAAGRAFTELGRSYQPLVSEFEGNNLKLICSCPGGAMMFGFREKIDTLEQLSGLKIRAGGRNIKDVERLGGTPVSIAAPEIYEALERGTIDGLTTMPLDGFKALGLYQVSPYILDPGMGVYAVSVCIVMNLDTWNRLPSDIQTIILETSDELIGKNTELLMAYEDEMVREMAAAGTTLYSLSPDEMERWKEAITPECWDEYIDELEQKGLPARELFDRYVALVKKYEKESKYIPPFER